MSQLFLASASPRRHEILTQLGIAHKQLNVPAPYENDEPQWVNETANDYVKRTAREKVLQARKIQNTGIILAADTCVILDHQVLGKPKDFDDARRILTTLSNTEHEVHTAIAICNTKQIFETVSISQVIFKTLSQKEIIYYCQTNEPYGKAGAYAIQGQAARFIKHLSGSYTGVMGLPAYETVELLKKAGLDI